MSILDQVRPGVRAMAGYKPGEQPRGLKRIVKLNTNENPYPPPQPVLDAINEAVKPERLRLYPEPTSRPVREAAGRAYGFNPDQVVVGNGSDDLLTIILRTFVDPGQIVAAPDPTYSLYKPLTDIQGGRYEALPWGENGALPIDELVQLGAKVIFVVRPNSPTGHAVDLEQVRELCRRATGLVVLDEAYADFCDDNGLHLVADHPNLVVTRTFSKTWSLAFLRIGLGFMSAELAEQMHKVRDSYNLDGVAQAAAAAALDHKETFEPAITAVREQRTRIIRELEQRGFSVPPSQSNFVLAKIPAGELDGAGWLQALRSRGVIVRYFGSHPELAGKLRISVGSPDEVDFLLEAVDQILQG